MIDNKVDNDVDSSLVGLVNELFEVVIGSEGLVNGIIINNIILVI